MLGQCPLDLLETLSVKVSAADGVNLRSFLDAKLDKRVVRLFHYAAPLRAFEVGHPFAAVERICGACHDAALLTEFGCSGDDLGYVGCHRKPLTRLA